MYCPTKNLPAQHCSDPLSATNHTPDALNTCIDALNFVQLNSVKVELQKWVTEAEVRI